MQVDCHRTSPPFSFSPCLCSAEMLMSSALSTYCCHDLSQAACFAPAGCSNMLNQSSSGHALASSSHQNLGQLASQQRAPLPYPGQGPSSLAGSLGYSANLSSAGSDRASPSSVAARTNLAAQMGFGSNPNLQSLDQLQTQLPHREQLTWQQQLLAQQQQQQPYDYGSQSLFPGGFQNHHGHHLPAVPTWQNSANPLHQPAAPGHFGQNPRVPVGSTGWSGSLSNHSPYSLGTGAVGIAQGVRPVHHVTVLWLRMWLRVRTGTVAH